MPFEPFPITFAPAQQAVNLLAQIANDATSPHQKQAQATLASWRECLATPAQIAMVDTDDDLEIDDAGACISASENGFFIQTWTWIECDMAETDDDANQAF